MINRREVISMRNMEMLFQEIKKATGVEDIGYHKIKDGRLNPVYKSKTGEVDLERWIEVHSKNPVYIANNTVLQEVIEAKKPIVVNDVKADHRSTEEFILFGIDSLMVVPIIKDNEVFGIIPIVSVGKIHNFTSSEAVECEEIVKKYYSNLIEE